MYKISLKKLTKSSLFLRLVSPLALGVLFCLLRNVAVSLGHAEPFPVEILSPYMFMFATILCILSYITLVLYPAFWVTDYFSKKSNSLLVIPSLLVPILFTLIVHIGLLNESIQNISWTKSYSAYLLCALVSGWSAMTWILSRKTEVLC